MTLIYREDLIKRLPEVDLDYDEMITRNGAIADIIALIYETPTVDAVSVVRCGNCVYRKTGGRCRLNGCYTDMEYFCAYGRKEDKQ